MKDWRGNEYGIGSTVLYAATTGSMPEITEGVVTDIALMYREPVTWDWKRLKEGAQLPRALRWDQETRGYVEREEPVEHKLRVRVKPLRSSRSFSRKGDTYVRDEDGGIKRNEFGTPEILRPAEGYRDVTITRVENITAL
jgi:hypothetical protein